MSHDASCHMVKYKFYKLIISLSLSDKRILMFLTNLKLHILQAVKHCFQSVKFFVLVRLQLPFGPNFPDPNFGQVYSSVPLSQVFFLFALYILL